MKIYLDNSSAAKPSKEVVSEMIPLLSEGWGDPTAPHQRGQQVMAMLKPWVDAIYRLVGADEEDSFVFTSSGSEAVNQAIGSTYTDVTIPSGRNQYIVAATDEAALLLSAGRLERFGCVVKTASCNKEGAINAASIIDQMNPRTALVSLSWANGLTGVINAIDEIGAVCRDRGVRFHVDATHALGKIDIDWKGAGVDLLTFDGAPLHAPQGTGALFTRQGVRVSPAIVGGHDQGGQRGGLFHPALLAGLGKAAMQAVEARDLVCIEGARLRNLFEERVVHGYPEAKVLFKASDRLPTVTALSFRGIWSEALLYLLNQNGVFASMGGGRFQQLALLLEASGIDPYTARSSLSFSFSRDLSDADVKRAADLVINAANQLRQVSKELV